jgi:DNA-directed RNA polymerase specialized sigma24 family protein
MTNTPSPVPDNDLSAAKFESLLLRLDTDRNRAGEKYEEIRWKLIKFFQWNSCLEAEELTDETFNRVAGKLTSEGEVIDDVVAFAWGVAKRIKQEALRKGAKTVRLPDLLGAETFFAAKPVMTDAQREPVGNQRRLKCLRRCIQGFSAENRLLLLTYHSPRGRRIARRRRLAQENGITMLALRVRVNRLRFKLEECIKKCVPSQTG